VSVRTLQAADLPQLRSLVASDTVRHCFVHARLNNRDPSDFLGYEVDGSLESVLFLGANVVPVATTGRARAAFADWLRRRARRASSIVGPDTEVLDLWRLLEPAWGPARDIRPRQPLLILDTSPIGVPDPQVRLARADDLDALLPACEHMFREEVGVPPYRFGGKAGYRARIAEIISAGHAFIRYDGDRVMFKAEIGSATPEVCQIQGVWVAPELRGQGFAAPALASVITQAQSSIAPVVSLYVNDYNTVARRVYERVGFREIDRFATVLF